MSDNVNLRGISFELVNPQEPTELSDVRIREMADLSLRAFSDSELQLPHSQRHTDAQLVHFLGIEDEAIYTAAQRDPQTLVGTHYREGQRLWRPRTALAIDTESNQLIGFASTVDNVSGSEKEMALKANVLIAKRYRMLRMIAVEPEFQGRGVGHALALLSWKSARPGQPASAYMIANEGPRRSYFLRSCGLELDHSARQSHKKPYGEDAAEPSLQLRYHSPGLFGARAAAKHIQYSKPKVAAAVRRIA